jgi:endonuclease YncB( thermonuclease family)
MRIASLSVLALLFISPATAEIPVSATLPQNCPAIGDVPATFASPVSASGFRTREGKEIRLAGVIGPGEDGQNVSPADAAAARAALTTFLSGQPLLLTIVAGPDRYQRMTAEVLVNGEWVQDAIVRRGLLRVAPELSAGACLTTLLNAEQDAAGKMAGHWSDGTFRIRTPDQVTGRGGKFEIVQGEVWRTRFTLAACRTEVCD